MAADRTFSAGDVIRIYNDHLTPLERVTVRAHFFEEVFGSPGWFEQAIGGILEAFARRVSPTLGQPLRLREEAEEEAERTRRVFEFEAGEIPGERGPQFIR